MAGRIPPTKQEITAAIKAYLEKHDGIACEYKRDDDCYELTDANGKGAIVGPGWQCNDGGLFNELREILMSQREASDNPKLPVSPSKGMNVPAKVRNGSSGAMTTPGDLSSLTVQDIINYINPKATEQEAYLFLEFCKKKHADPMKKQIYLVVYEGERGRNVSFITGKEYFTEKAEVHPQFDGFRAGIIVRSKEGGDLIHREGTFYIPSEEMLLGGWAEVSRKDRRIPSKAEVLLAEYNTGKSQWAKMPATMIRKVAIVQSLREAFPVDLGGMYDRSEMNQARIDIDPEKEVAEA